MKKRHVFYCVAALMLASLVTPNAFPAPAVEHAMQDRGRGGRPTSKRAQCNECKEERKSECGVNTPGGRVCLIQSNLCKNNLCGNLTGTARQECLDRCEVRYKICLDTCAKAKCKEECEGVDDDPPEGD